ncbi:hypothetical protein D9603_00420 [Pseudoalteromonas sp. PS5]|nr:hypothetical protein D9603_00420 [Pseudoalteromonas sp. PS5]
MVLLSNQKFGLLYFPGPRALAYVNVLANQKVLPSIIITLANKRGENGIRKSRDLPFGEKLFPKYLTIEDFSKGENIPIVELDVESINHPDVISALSNSGQREWLFTGGGILKQPLFEVGIKYIHIHPGKLPEVKGSTCFYYSLLFNNTLHASVFYMTPKLDSGKALLVKPFNINIKPSDLSSEFIDYVLDPWIRASALASFIKQESYDITPLDTPSNRPCYIMHPVLRALTIKKLHSRFDVNKPEGIFDGE